MNVKMIALTRPITGNISETFDPGKNTEMTPEEFVAYVARVSNPSNQNNVLTADKLLKYLVKNKHWSPFEMLHVVMEITATRDIVRQILRHRSFSFQEFSQRYADPSKDMGFTIREARLQDIKNRQNSIDSDDAVLKTTWNIKQQQIIHEASLAYNWAVNNGIAKEQARSVLPEGNTNSRIYMAGSLRSWIHYCQLRMENGTQKEHREIAINCWKLLCEEFTFLKNLN